MRNEANRGVCRAAAVRECETKPIRGGGGRGKNAWATGAERSQSHFRTVRWQFGNPLCIARGWCGTKPIGRCAGRRQSGDAKRSQSAGGGGRGAERSQSHFRTVRGNSAAIRGNSVAGNETPKVRGWGLRQNCLSRRCGTKPIPFSNSLAKREPSLFPV
jgi:hypothetical protein